MTSDTKHSQERQPAWGITIPNLLTVTRILLTPLFVIFLIRERFGYALLVFIAAGVSDGLDGLIARYFNQRTTLGALLDPIADKVLLSAGFVCLAVLMVIPGWLTVVVISRDVVIMLGIAVFAIMNIDFEVKPTVISKITTVFQVVTVCLALINLEISGLRELQLIFYWATAGLTILSGLHYIFVGLSILQRGGNSNVGGGSAG